MVYDVTRIWLDWYLLGNCFSWINDRVWNFSDEAIFFTCHFLTRQFFKPAIFSGCNFFNLTIYQESILITLYPNLDKWSDVEEPITPAPMIATSYIFLIFLHWAVRYMRKHLSLCLSEAPCQSTKDVYTREPAKRLLTIIFIIYINAIRHTICLLYTSHAADE